MNVVCVEVCWLGGPVIDPDRRDAVTSETDLVTERQRLEKLRRFVQQYMPGLESVPALLESCIITACF